jgi:hypothetical protein
MARDAELRGIAEALEGETHQFAAPMSSVHLKAAFFASANVARSRDASGRSLKRKASE